MARDTDDARAALEVVKRITKALGVANARADEVDVPREGAGEPRTKEDLVVLGLGHSDSVKSLNKTPYAIGVVLCCLLKCKHGQHS